MTIVATAAVPAQRRLDLADTETLPAAAGEFQPAMAAKIYQLGVDAGVRRAEADLAAAFRRGMVAGAQRLAEDGRTVTHPGIGQDRSIEVAFDAGRRFEQITAGQTEKLTRDAYWHGYSDAITDTYGASDGPTDTEAA